MPGAMPPPGAHAMPPVPQPPSTPTAAAKTKP
jgi:hypothetical protein